LLLLNLYVLLILLNLYVLHVFNVQVLFDHTDVKYTTDVETDVHLLTTWSTLLHVRHVLLLLLNLYVLLILLNLYVLLLLNLYVLHVFNVLFYVLHLHLFPVVLRS